MTMIKVKNSIESAIGTLTQIASHLGAGSMTPATNMNLVTEARSALAEAKDRVDMLLRVGDAVERGATLEPTLLSVGAPDLEFKRTQQLAEDGGLDMPPGRGWVVSQMIAVASNGKAWIELLWSREKRTPRTALMDEIDQERDAQDKLLGGAQHDDRHTDNEWTRKIVQTAWLGLGFDPGEKPADQAPETAKNAKEYRKRLVQVAALAVAALEAFDRRGIVPSDELVEEEARELYMDYRAAKPITVGGTSMPTWEENKMPDVREAWRSSARRSLLRHGDL